jgi:hypothetical protein
MNNRDRDDRNKEQDKQKEEIKPETGTGTKLPINKTRKKNSKQVLTSETSTAYKIIYKSRTRTHNKTDDTRQIMHNTRCTMTSDIT